MTKAKEIPWYSEEADFFGERYFVEYERSLPEERTKREVAFLEKILPVEEFPRILDVPCGHGRHSVLLAKRGYQVTGQDLNGFFLAKARESVEETGVSLDIDFLKGDMREIPFRRQFDAVINMFTAFGYFDTESADRKALQAMARALKPGGKFIMDFLNREWVVRNFLERDWRELSDGSLLLIKRRLDLTTGYAHDIRMLITPNGERRTDETTLRWYTTQELIGMMKKVGLTVEKTYGDFDGGPLTLDSQRTILVARKD